MAINTSKNLYIYIKKKKRKKNCSYIDMETFTQKVQQNQWIIFKKYVKNV